MSDDIIKKASDFQATENIIMLGHVANGKSTLVEKMTGIKTQRFKSEIMGGGRTHHMGYANVKIFKHPFKNDIGSYVFVPCTDLKYVDDDGIEYELIHHISLSDPPGHNDLLGEMLNGTTSMCNCKAIIVIGGNNKTIPSPQTVEHVMAMKLLGIEPIMVVFNKVDIIKKERHVIEKYNEWMKFAKEFEIDHVPVVPVSAVHGLNIDYLAYFLGNKLKCNNKRLNDPTMLVAMRSWNINKSGIDPRTMQGGTFGGSIQRGILNVGDSIKIRPGLVFINESGRTRFSYYPLKTEVVSLKSEKSSIKYAIPGGLVGVSTKLDSSLSQQDGLVGSVMSIDGVIDELNVYENLKLNCEFASHFKYLSDDITEKDFEINIGDKVIINASSKNVVATINDIVDNTIDVKLNEPVVCGIGKRVAISKITDSYGIRLLGSGIMEEGIECELDETKFSD